MRGLGEETLTVCIDAEYRDLQRLSCLVRLMLNREGVNRRRSPFRRAAEVRHASWPTWGNWYQRRMRMALVRWESFEGLASLRREVDRLFEDFFERGARRLGNLGAWEPAVEVADT